MQLRVEWRGGKQKLRQLHTHRYGEPEVPESAFWKKIIAYQQKLLVRLLVLIGCPWLWVAADPRESSYHPHLRVHSPSCVKSRMSEC